MPAARPRRAPARRAPLRARACCPHRRRRRRSRFARDAAGDLAAGGLDPRLRLVAGERAAACRSAPGCGRPAGPSRRAGGAPSSQWTPAARSAPITSRLCGSPKKRTMLSASTGPTSRTLCSASSSAAIRASRLPKCCARSRAVASPTWRMPRAYTKRCSVVRRLAVDRRDHVGRRLLAHPVERRQPRDVQRVEVGRRARPAPRRPAGRRASRRGPRCPCARRLAKCSSACLRCAGQTSPPLQRATASSGRRDDRRAALGAALSASRTRAAPAGRCSATTRTTSGITSPARRTTTVSPTRTSLRRTSSSLCSVALVDGDAADEHRLQPRDRRDRAGAADLDVDAQHLGRHFLGRELVRDREARRARDEAELGLLREAVDLVDDAVDVVGQLRPPRRHGLGSTRAGPRRRERPPARRPPESRSSASRSRSSLCVAGASPRPQSTSPTP